MTTLTKQKLLSPSSIFGLLVAISLAAVFLFLMMPEGFIKGTSSYWLSQQDDITQYIAGFNAYFSQEWNFPIWKLDAFNYPIGTRTTFTDSIPIYAFLLKLFVPASAFPFNPYGYWVAFCFIAQAIAVWLILKELKNTSWLALIVLTTLLLTFPALLARLGHISLMSHFIILFAFYLYIRSARVAFQPILWTLLLTVVFHINIYLFTMAVTIFFATIAQRYKDLPLKTQLLQLSLPLIVLASSLFLTIFPLESGTFTRDFGWGYYSMNLLSPFDGSSFFTIPNAQMPGQYEGFNYLGLGILLFFPYAIQLQRQNDTTFYKRHRYMLILLALFAIYSLSYKIYFGHFKVLSFSYPSFMDSLVHQFRASGRFFWPVAYAIMIFSVVMISKYSTRYKYLLLVLLCFIQFSDLKNRFTIFEQTSLRNSPTHLDTQKWKNTLSKSTENLYFYPKFRCGKKPPHTSLLPTMLFAAQNKLTLNTGYIARYQPNCNDIAQEISHSNPATSSYIFVKNEFTYEKINSFLPKDFNLTCKELDFAWICSKPSLLKASK